MPVALVFELVHPQWRQQPDCWLYCGILQLWEVLVPDGAKHHGSLCPLLLVWHLEALDPLNTHKQKHLIICYPTRNTVNRGTIKVATSKRFILDKYYSNTRFHFILDKRLHSFPAVRTLYFNQRTCSVGWCTTSGRMCVHTCDSVL